MSNDQKEHLNCDIEDLIEQRVFFWRILHKAPLNVFPSYNVAQVKAQ